MSTRESHWRENTHSQTINGQLLLANPDEEKSRVRKKSDKCQQHSNILHAPIEIIYSVTYLWLLYKWGINILDTKGRGHLGYLPLGVISWSWKSVIRNNFIGSRKKQTKKSKEKSPKRSRRNRVDVTLNHPTITWVAKPILRFII